MPPPSIRRRSLARLTNDEINLLRRHSTPRSLAHRAADEVALFRNTLLPRSGPSVHQQLVSAVELVDEMRTSDGDALSDLCDALVHRLTRCAEAVKALTP